MSLGEGPLSPLFWSACAVPNEKKVKVWRRDFAFLPGPPCLWEEERACAPRTTGCEDDVSAWPYSVCILVKISAFLGSLYWPSEGRDLGVEACPTFNFLSPLRFGLVSVLSCYVVWI